MYVVIAGGGKVGWNLARELIEKDHEVTLIEQDRRRYLIIEEELEHAVQYGDSTELWVLERAGHPARRPGHRRHRRRRGQHPHLPDRQGEVPLRADHRRASTTRGTCSTSSCWASSPAVSATDLILRLIEHEVPQYGLVHLLDLPGERLEIIEVEVAPGAPAAGALVQDIALPEGCLIISVLRDGGGFVPKADTVIEAGDEVLLVLDPGLEDQVTPLFSS